MTNKTTRMISIFDYADHEIRLEVSMLSGAECLYLNDQLIEKKRNLTSFHSVFDFTLAGKPAQVRLAAKGWMGGFTGDYSVELWVDGQHVDSDEFDYVKSTWTTAEGRRKGLTMLLGFMAAGFVVGTVMAFLVKH